MLVRVAMVASGPAGRQALCGEIKHAHGLLLARVGLNCLTLVGVGALTVGNITSKVVQSNRC